MEIIDRKEKINFLEEVLDIAKENFKFIPEKGAEIFDADSRHVQEKCSIGIKIDGVGNPYFTIHGTYVRGSNKITEPEKLLIIGERYLSKSLSKFKQGFHLYKDYNNQSSETDLINSIR
ncbi:hypothetical protein KAI04_01515 [Candidatus Pacearchaeota archaeon]|nr:hypothetical protein [Candidatus Pacearchaeota archaeon]